MTSSIPENIANSIKEAYGNPLQSTKPVHSYYGGVFDITLKSSQSYILKIVRHPDSYKMNHLNAEVAFCRYVKEHVDEFTTQTFVPGTSGKVLQQSDDDCYYLLEKHQIVKKDILAKEDQMMIGHLMNSFHKSLKDFKHDGIGESSWMREVDDEEYTLLQEHFDEQEFASYVKPLDYEKLGLTKTLLHGDWHGDNFSFSKPPFLYDLDTLCYGSPAEEIARSITHWYTGVPLKEFYDNLIEGYKDLSNHEIGLIPKIAVAICYKQFAEVTNHGDHKYAEHFKMLANEVKQVFGLL